GVAMGNQRPSLFPSRCDRPELSRRSAALYARQIFQRLQSLAHFGLHPYVFPASVAESGGSRLDIFTEFHAGESCDYQRRGGHESDQHPECPDLRQRLEAVYVRDGPDISENGASFL